MLATDEHAENLFARLFSYAPRAKRNPREDYCTEALAWLLVRSPEFAVEFLKTIRERLGPAANTQLANYRGALDVSTQVSYTGEDDDGEEENGDENNGSAGGRFDLVLKPAGRDDFIVVVESKVGLDPKVGAQAAEYKMQLETNPKFSPVSEGERYVVTLTPASGTHPGADAHLSWQQVHELLHKSARTLSPADPMLVWFTDFADFLKSHYLALMKLPILDSATIQSFQQLAPLLVSAQEHFGAFAADNVLRQFFSTRDAARPMVVDYDGKDKVWGERHVWYGIECTKMQRTAYAGFVFQDDKTGLCAQVYYTGDVTARLSKIEGEPKLKDAVATAKKFFRSYFHREGEGTTISFVCQLVGGDATDARSWFRKIFDEIR